MGAGPQTRCLLRAAGDTRGASRVAVARPGLMLGSALGCVWRVACTVTAKEAAVGVGAAGRLPYTIAPSPPAPRGGSVSCDQIRAGPDSGLRMPPSAFPGEASRPPSAPPLGRPPGLLPGQVGLVGGASPLPKLRGRRVALGLRECDVEGPLRGEREPAPVVGGRVALGPPGAATASYPPLPPWSQ